MCKRLTKSSGFHKTLRCLQKRKENTWGEMQEKCVLSGSKENYRNLHGRKHLLLCCTEDRCNQSRQQIWNTWEIDPVGSKWLAKVSGAPEKTILGWILPSTSSATGWKWGEVQCCSPNKIIRRIYHSNTNYF